MRIGIFGGTFDPPHIGHSILASEAISQLKLDRLLWVLTPEPPHKKLENVSPVEQRLELVRAALRDDPSFQLSRVEIDRPGPHYTCDTVRILAEENPGSELFFLIGGDSLHDLPKWYNPLGLVESLSGFGVMHRLNDHVNLEVLYEAIPQIQEKIFFFETPLIEISASMIRQRIREGRMIRYYLLPSVYQIIKEKKLYSGS